MNFNSIATAPVYIAVHCLRYGSDNVQVMEVTREELSRMRSDRKKGIAWHNEYIQRITVSKAIEIMEQEGRKETRKAYDKAIMSKYNVSENYRQNRWFMEQVRPTIF